VTDPERAGPRPRCRQQVIDALYAEIEKLASLSQTGTMVI
jgi:hypothetical protein